MYKKKCATRAKLLFCLLNLLFLFVCLFACLFFDILVALASSDLQVLIYLRRDGERDASFFYLLVCQLFCMLP